MKERIPVLTPVKVAEELWLFARRPRQLVKGRKLDWSRPASASAVLGWATAMIILPWALHGWAFGSVMESSLRAQGSDVRVKAQLPVSGGSAASRPEIAEFALTPQFGIGLFFPELADLPPAAPQKAMVKAGFLYLSLAGVVPESLSRGAFPLLLLAIFAIVAVLCLYPPARLLGGRGSPMSSLRMMTIYCAYAALGVSTLALAAIFLFVDLLALSGATYSISMVIAGQLPVLTFLIRGYFASFSEYFELSKKRIALASLLAAALTAVVSPLVFLPGIYLLLRFQPFWDLVF